MKESQAIKNLMPRQRIFLKHYLETGNASLSARKAGYKDDFTTPYKILGSSRFQEAYQELLDKKGISDAKLIACLSQGLEATKTISAYVHKSKPNPDLEEADESTNDFVDVPDFATRHKYLETGLKLRGRLQDNKEKEDFQAPIVIVRSNGNKTQVVAGRVHIHNGSVPGNGVSMGNGKIVVRHSKNSETLPGVSE